jgi:uncharacterized membrane protein YfcA
MITHFGWKAAVAVFVNAVVLTWLFRRELITKGNTDEHTGRAPMPLAMAGIHLAFLFGVVLFAHHPVVFMGLFLFFLGFTEAYKAHQDRLILRKGCWWPSSWRGWWSWAGCSSGGSSMPWWASSPPCCTSWPRP